MMNEGDAAPDFELPTDGDGTPKPSDPRGRPVVIYLYPKDDTSGCTKEAIEKGRRQVLRRLGAKKHVRSQLHGRRTLDVSDRAGWKCVADLAQGEGTGSCARSARGRRATGGIGLALSAAR